GNPGEAGGTGRGGLGGKTWFPPRFWGRAGFEPAALGLKGGLGGLGVSRLPWKSGVSAQGSTFGVSVGLGGSGCRFVATLCCEIARGQLRARLGVAEIVGVAMFGGGASLDRS